MFDGPKSIMNVDLKTYTHIYVVTCSPKDDIGAPGTTQVLVSARCSSFPRPVLLRCLNG